MNRDQLAAHIAAQYGARGEHPWLRLPNYVVFRHPISGKWFGLLMDLPQSRLGLPGDKIVDVLNLKCDPVLIGSLRTEPGIYPAYHMSKATWISIVLDGSVPTDKLLWLLDMSYELTAPRRKKRT